MRLVSTKKLPASSILARPIVNDDGIVLLQEGVTLTERIVKKIQEKGITYVYIEDGRTDDIEVSSPIHDKTRGQALATIKNEFRTIMQPGRLQSALTQGQVSKSFSTVVDKILEDIETNDDAIGILSDIYMYDSYIFTHSLNVTIYTLRLAMKMGYNKQELQAIGLGAILHDVGKLNIPSEILQKPTGLTEAEFTTIKKHPEDGFLLLKDMPNLSLLTAHCAYQHHERLNGSGYPRGIKEEAIHPYAKLLAIADVFDATTSNRVYRNAMLPHEAMEILFSGAGTLYDFQAVEVFSRVIAMYPNGMTLTLNDGRQGVVVRQNGEMTTRPVIRILTDHNYNKVDKPYEVDLLKDTNVTIISCEELEAM